MSIMPFRCFTCGKVINELGYRRKLEEGKTMKDSLDELGYTRICCRRIFMGHDYTLFDKILAYGKRNKTDDFEEESKLVKRNAI